MVKNKINTLIINPSFNHNLCCKYSNGQCEPILDIYVLKALQWYKEIFNSMIFGPLNHFLKIQKSIETPTLKVGPLGSVWAHSFTLSYTPENVYVIFGLHSQPTPFHALTLVEGYNCDTCILRTIVMFIIEYLVKTNLAFKNIVLEKLFGHLLLKMFCHHTFKICKK